MNEVVGIEDGWSRERKRERDGNKRACVEYASIHLASNERPSKGTIKPLVNSTRHCRQICAPPIITSG